MKPIMKSRLMVVEEIERGGASNAFSKIRYRGELHKKEWKTWSAPTHATAHLRTRFATNVSVMFSVSIQHSLCAVRKALVSLREYFFSSSFLSKTVCTFELISVNRPVTVQKRERKGVQLHLISCIGEKLIGSSASLSAVFRRGHRN